jgi:hypothetical protein
LEIAAVIDFKCPHCGYELRTQDSSAGKKGKCKSCGKPVRIPPPLSLVKSKVEAANGPAVKIEAVKRPAGQPMSHAPSPMLMGLLSVAVCWIPIVGWIGLPLCLTGFIVASVRCCAPLGLINRLAAVMALLLNGTSLTVFAVSTIALYSAVFGTIASVKTTVDTVNKSIDRAGKSVGKAIDHAVRTSEKAQDQIGIQDGEPKRKD